MSANKCPLCESACIIKIVATEDSRWCEVDVCKLCGTMYPRGRKVVQVKEKKKAVPKAKPKTTKKKPKKK
jgi:hypothetical protein